MSEKRVRLGSISILFVVIVLCVAVMAVLTVSTVRADQAMTQRYAQQVSERYALQSEGQCWLSEVDAALQRTGGALTQADLPAETTLEDNQVSVTLTTENRVLYVQLELDGTGGYQITAWTDTARWEEDEQLELLQ